MKNAIIKATARFLAKVWIWSLILFFVLGIPSILLFIVVILFRWAFL